MADKNIAIRLSVVDGQKVKAELASVGETGDKALRRIGDASAHSAKGLNVFGGATSAMRGELDSFAGRLGPVGGALSALGPAGLVAGTAIAATVGVFKSAVVEAEALAVEQRKLEAVLRASGGAAKLTKDQMVEFADELEHLTLFDDAEITKAQATLATFKSVSGDAFKQTIRLAADLSTVFGTDLQSATTMLGKALEDPVEGLGALRRVGVSFADEQKELIKTLVETGQAAEAQRVILKALTEQVGGAAEAQQTGLTGATNSVSDAWGNFLVSLESTLHIGQAVAGTLNVIADGMNRLSGNTRKLNLDEQIAGKQQELAALKQPTNKYIVHNLDQKVAAKEEELRVLQEEKQAAAAAAAKEQAATAHAPAAAAVIGAPKARPHVSYRSSASTRAKAEAAPFNADKYLVGITGASPAHRAAQDISEEQERVIEQLQRDGEEARRTFKDMQREALEASGQYVTAIEMRRDADIKAWKEQAAAAQITVEQTEDGIRLINEAYSERLKNAAESQENDRLEKLTGPLGGVEQGIAEYFKEAGDVTSQVKKVTVTAFEGMEDALTKFATTGKLSFKDLGKTMLSELAGLGSKGLMSSLGSLFGASGSSGGGSLGSILGSLFGSAPGAAPGAAGGGGLGAMLMSFFHTGGVVGTEGTLGYANAAAFLNAPRFHTGGMIGADERPIIAKVGEGVFTPAQMRAMGGRVSVTVNNNSGAKVDVAEREGPNGLEIEMQINEAVARSISHRGSKANQAARSANSANPMKRR